MVPVRARKREPTTPFPPGNILLVRGVKGKDCSHGSTGVVAALDNVEVEDKIKATVALNADVYESSSNNPSSAVENEPFLSSFNSTCDNVTFTFPALHDVHKAQGNDGVGDKIKAIAALNADRCS
ncbi:hypothetical protein Peur_036779 [Populus x canadensis]